MLFSIQIGYWRNVLVASFLFECWKAAGKQIATRRKRRIELEKSQKQRPGSRIYTASRRCSACGGYFLGIFSCIFSRYYAYLESPIIYSVFNCPIRELAVEANFLFQIQKTEKYNKRCTQMESSDMRVLHIGTTVLHLLILPSTFTIYWVITRTQNKLDLDIWLPVKQSSLVEKRKAKYIVTTQHLKLLRRHQISILAWTVQE